MLLNDKLHATPVKKSHAIKLTQKYKVISNLFVLKMYYKHLITIISLN